MKRILAVAAILTIAAWYWSKQVVAQPACEPGNTPPVCQPGSGITINNQSRSVAPPNICVSPGQSISVTAVPDGGASIQGKGGGWPNGSGSSFTLTAPNAPGEYDYNVFFSDGTCLDPRITVK